MDRTLLHHDTRVSAKIIEEQFGIRLLQTNRP